MAATHIQIVQRKCYMHNTSAQQGTQHTHIHVGSTLIVMGPTHADPTCMWVCCVPCCAPSISVNTNNLISSCSDLLDKFYVRHCQDINITFLQLWTILTIFGRSGKKKHTHLTRHSQNWKEKKIKKKKLEIKHSEKRKKKKLTLNWRSKVREREEIVELPEPRRRA